MDCYLCGNQHFKKKKNGVRDNLKVNIIECCNCGLVTLDSFSHITENFYEDSKMHDSPVSIKDWLKETEKDDDRRSNDLSEIIINKNILDFGCGNGGFLFKIKKSSKNANGIELENQFKPFFKNNGLEVYNSIQHIKDSSKIKFDIITAFHVFEHLKDPLQTLEELEKLLCDDGQIIIEVPNANDALLSLYNCKSFADFTYWSQHLFLFNEKTIKMLIEKSSFKINWIKQIQRYPLSNHLYWLSKNSPGGHEVWNFFDNKINKLYTSALAKRGLCDTIIISISKII